MVIVRTGDDAEMSGARYRGANWITPCRLSNGLIDLSGRTIAIPRK